MELFHSQWKNQGLFRLHCCNVWRCWKNTVPAILVGTTTFSEKSFKYRLAKTVLESHFAKLKWTRYAKVRQLFKPTSHYKLILKSLLLFVVSCLTLQAMAIQYWAFPWWQISHYFCQVSCISIYYMWGNITDLKPGFIVRSSVSQHIRFILGYILYKILLTDCKQKM